MLNFALKYDPPLTLNFKMTVRYEIILPCCSCFLVNTADRVIRVYNSEEVKACGKDGEPEPIQKLQDLVNK